MPRHTEALHFGRFEERHVDDFASMHGHAFAFEKPDTLAWLDAAGRDNIRIVVRGGRVMAGLAVVPMGQFFGGRSVPTFGIAGVCARADVQRQGMAKFLMRQALLEAAKSNVPLSTLYASTKSLYRGVGYEMAGSHFRTRFGPVELPQFAVEPGLRLREIEDADLPQVEALYLDVARTQPGQLERGRYIWDRVRGARFGIPQGILVEGDEGIEGYIYYAKRKHERGFRHAVVLVDLVGRTPRALRRLWSFVRGLGSMVECIDWFSEPADPAFMILPDPRFGLQLVENFMLRIVDVPAALTARGWPTGIGSRIDFEIEDPLIESNAGAWTMTLEDGRASVHRGGTPRARLSIRALASLYGSFASSDALLQIGELEADEETRRAIDGAFAGPRAWCRDMF